MCAALCPGMMPREVPVRAQVSRVIDAFIGNPFDRIVMVAGRCYRALAAVLGGSERMNRVRRDTWAACFGDLLRSALDLERVIRDHDVLLFGETGTGKEAIALAIQLATPGGTDGAPPHERGTPLTFRRSRAQPTEFTSA